MILFTVIGVLAFAIVAIALGTQAILKIADNTRMDVSDSVLALFGVVILIIAIIFGILG